MRELQNQSKVEARAAATAPKCGVGVPFGITRALRRAESGREQLAQATELFLIGTSRFQRLFEGYRYKAGLLVGLHLADQVEVGADHRADHRVATAGYGIAVQHDRF